MQAKAFETHETTAATTERPHTFIEQAFIDNPMSVVLVDPDDQTQIIIDPANNSRSTPLIGDKSLAPLVQALVRERQQQPGLGIIDPATGIFILRAGFRRGRAIQTFNEGKAAEDRMLFRVMLMPGATTNLDAFERSISENAQRVDPNMMEKAQALAFFLSPEGGEHTLREAASKMNMAIGAASTYARFMLFPPVTKKALAAGKIPYGAAEKFVALLPSRDDMLADEQGEKLKAAQDRIANMTKKELEASGKVNTGNVDKATRKVKGKKGQAANSRQRSVKGIVTELDEWVSGLEDPKVHSALVVQAFKKFIAGGSIGALVKVIEAA